MVQEVRPAVRFVEGQDAKSIPEQTKSVPEQTPSKNSHQINAPTSGHGEPAEVNPKLDNGKQPLEIGKKFKRLSVACCKCSRRQRSILKGYHRTIPLKHHLVQYWKQRIRNQKIQKKNAIVVDGNNDLNISYRELDEFSNNIAYNLKQAKFSEDYEILNDSGEFVIAVCHPACYEYVVVILAILKLGAAILPISIDLPATRIAEILHLVQPVLLIASPNEDDLFRDVVNLIQVDIIYVDEIWNMLVQDIKGEHSHVTPVENPDVTKKLPKFPKRTVAIGIAPLDGQNLAALSFDSRSIMNRIKWEDHYFVYYKSEYVLMPPHFDSVDSIADIMTALIVGVTIIAYQSPTDVLIPEQLFSYCQNYKIRRLYVWPSLLKACTTALHLFSGHQENVRTVRYWLCTGGVLRSALAEEFFGLVPPNAQLVHMYSFGHCMGAVTFQSFEAFVSHRHRSLTLRLPVGCPVPNMDVYLLDEKTLHPVKDGELGAIYVSGPQLANRTDKNKAYVENPFSRHSSTNKFMIRTMDMGRVFTKTNGVRVLIHEVSSGSRHLFVENQVVWLDAIELQINKLTSFVSECHCMCYRANEDDQLILAFCVPAAEKPPTGTEESIEKELMKELSIHHIPEVILVPNMIYDASGAPDETQLLSIYQQQRRERVIYNDWQKLKISNVFVLRAAKILAYVLFSFLGVSIKTLVEVCWNSPYLSIRRSTITKGAHIVKELHRNRYPIFIDDFIYAEDLQRIAELMVVARKERGVYKVNNCPADEAQFLVHRYKLEIMVNSNKHSVCSLLARALTHRGELDYFADVSYASMRTFLDVLWPLFVTKNLSLCINRKRIAPRMVGAALAINWHDEFKFTQYQIPKEIMYKLELIAYLEAGLTNNDFSQTTANVIEICYIGLDHKLLTDAEINGLTDKVIRTYLAFGKVKGFEAIVVITYDYFAYEICVKQYEFQVARHVQVNQFVASDGTRPYSYCPDSTYATLCWRLYRQGQQA